jgi:hypothetical protein
MYPNRLFNLKIQVERSAVTTRREKKITRPQDMRKVRPRPHIRCRRCLTPGPGYILSVSTAEEWLEGTGIQIGPFSCKKPSRLLQPGPPWRP